MEKFKGTKGDWRVVESTCGLITETQCVTVRVGENDIITVWDFSEESQANALLISKAPEMLEEIQESLIDIQILRDQIAKESEINHRFEGMSGIMDNWINRKKQLIKEATEL